MKLWHWLFHGTPNKIYGWKPILGLENAVAWEQTRLRCECGREWEV